MMGVVLTFKAGDPVPTWLLAVEPRRDVPGGMCELVRPLTFLQAGQVIDDGQAYHLRPMLAGQGPVIGGHLKFCQMSNEYPIVFPDGECWMGSGPVQPAAWVPDPKRLRPSPSRFAVIRRHGWLIGFTVYSVALILQWVTPW